MTRNDFASLSSATFAVVVSKRQAYVTAEAALDALYDECQCDLGCRCHLREKIKAANKALSGAHWDKLDAERMWAEYCDIRREDARR